MEEPKEGRAHRQEAFKGVNLEAVRRREEGAAYGQGLGATLFLGHGSSLLNQQARTGQGTPDGTELVAISPAALGIADQDRIGRRVRALMDLEGLPLAEIGDPGALVVLVFWRAEAGLGPHYFVGTAGRQCAPVHRGRCGSGPFLRVLARPWER